MAHSRAQNRAIQLRSIPADLPHLQLSSLDQVHTERVLISWHRLPCHNHLIGLYVPVRSVWLFEGEVEEHGGVIDIELADGGTRETGLLRVDIDQTLLSVRDGPPLVVLIHCRRDLGKMVDNLVRDVYYHV